MTYTLHPCTRFDLCEVIERATPAQMGMLMGQIAAGNSFALRDGFGVAVACGGLVEVEAGIWQAWFCVNRETGPRAIVAVMRAIALTLEVGDYSVVQIEVGTPMGGRIAKALGFKRSDHGDSSMEIWTCKRLPAFSKKTIQQP
jgi:hypothetical protein